jgi:single-stranded-DNA-specific exonuclease
MRVQWSVHPQQPGKAKAFAQAAGVHPFTAQVLLNRGMDTPQQAQHFFSPQSQAFGDPFTLPDMLAAVERLKLAVHRQEPILVFSDSDVDGLTASVIAFELLRSAGARVQARHANRISDGYGLPDSAVQEIAASDVRVLLLLDCGTNQVDAVRRLSAAGIDTIILDHHVPIDGAAPAVAMVNPFTRQERQGRELCSAGLAFKLAQAWLYRSSAEGLDDYLDLAALGTLADCAPLRAESRLIVSRGMCRILDSRRPGLRRICEATGMTVPHPDQILRKLVPKLNASGRLGDCSAVWHLLCREAPESHETWMGLVDAAHNEIKRINKRILREAMAQASRIHFGDDAVVVVAGSGWHSGLMGPLASQLAQSYARPAIAIALNDGMGVGSARSVPSINVLEALKHCAGLLMRFGGHAQACGLTLPVEKLGEFRHQVNQEVRQAQSSGNAVHPAQHDLEAGLPDFSADWVAEWEKFAPFGMGNPQPTVVIRGVSIEVKSPRRGWATDGRMRLPIEGAITPGIDARVDLAASPVIESGELTLLLRDLRIASEP